MLARPKIDEERLTELRDILEKIPGASRKTWHLEIYDLRDGQDHLDQVIDIRTGEVIKQARKSKKKRQGAPG